MTFKSNFLDLRKDIFLKLRVKTDELIEEMSNVFETLDAIELIVNKQTKDWMYNNLGVLIQGGEEEEGGLSYESIESEFKDALVFKLSEKFVREFFEKKLKVPLIEEDMIKEFIEVTKIYFFNRNDLNIESESCSKFPIISYLCPWDSPLQSYILEKHLCEELKNIQMKHFFGERKSGSEELRLYIQNKLRHMLKEELTFIQSELNKFYRYKMNWILVLNTEYEYILEATE